MRCDFKGALLPTVLPPVLLMEIVLGILANGFALWIFCFQLKPWKSSTVLLFNLAVADFLLIMALPFRASYYLSGINWMFGESVCNIILFMLAMNRSGSTFFLMAIALDRYMCVVHPHHPINSCFKSVSKAMLGALILWLVPVAMTAHVFSLKHVNTTKCESFVIETETDHSLNWHKTVFLLSFYLPLSMIIYCTFHIVVQLRRRRLGQQAKMKRALCFIAVVVILFIVCFLPSNITEVLIWIKTHQVVHSLPQSEICPAMEEMTNTFFISISLTYFNSAMDPLVYYFSIPAFKNICRKVLFLEPAEPSGSTDKKTKETGSHSLSQL